MKTLKVSSDTAFKGNTLKGINNTLYALVDIKENKTEEGTIYTAVAIEINKNSEVADAIKQYKLDNIIVTVDNICFYGDSESRADISDAILEATELGLEETATQDWKTKDGIVPVTLAQLKTARKLALEAKGTIVGVS